MTWVRRGLSGLFKVQLPALHSNTQNPNLRVLSKRSLNSGTRGRAHRPLVQPLSLTPSCPSPDSSMPFPRALSLSHRAELSAAPLLPVRSHSTPLAHIQLAVIQNPQIPFHGAALQPFVPQSVHRYRVALSQVWNAALALVKFHTVDDFPDKILLQGLSNLKGVKGSSHLSVVYRINTPVPNS